MEPDTGVLRLSNKRRQGMKLSYQLNVSVSDGVFTSKAQVGGVTSQQLPLRSVGSLTLSQSLLVFTDGKPGDLR